MEHKTIDSKEKTKNSSKDLEYNLIDLYSQPEFIQLISQQVAEQSAVDLNKTTAIKQAIHNKNFVINELKVAEKIMQFETDLFDKS